MDNIQGYNLRDFTPEFTATVVTDVKLDSNVLSPDGDGVQDTVSGTAIFAKPYNGGISVVNVLGDNVITLVNFDKNKLGQYSFTWNGIDSYNNKVYDGPYFIQLRISENTNTGVYIPPNGRITVVNSKKLVIAQPEQKVRIMQRDYDLDPYYKSYGYPVNEFSIISFEERDEPIYHVKVAEGVVGTLDVRDVEMINLDKLPIQMGVAAIPGIITRTAPKDTARIKRVLTKNEVVRILRQDGNWYRIAYNSGEQAYAKTTDIIETTTTMTYTVVPGDSLWKIAQMFNTTISAITQLNNMTSSTPLYVGQNLIIPGTAPKQNIYIVPTDTPEIKYVKLSTRKLTFQGSAAPGYMVVDVETKIPTRGYIMVVGTNNTTFIKLSEVDYKTEHIVTWAPWDDTKKEPLPAQSYRLHLQLFDQNGSLPTVDLGIITVVPPMYTVQLIHYISMKPEEISPKYNDPYIKPVIVYAVNRPAMVQIVIKDDKGEYFHTPLEKKAPGLYKFSWDGRDDKGELMPNGTYTLEAQGIDLSYNSPNPIPQGYAKTSIRVYNSEYKIPIERIKQVVTDVKLDNIISPNGDGVQDILTGTITLSEKARVGVTIINAVERNVNFLLSGTERAPGTYSFQWNGKDFMGSPVYNGPYYLEIDLFEGESSGNMIMWDTKITVIDSIEIIIPPNAQKVKVIVDAAQMEVRPYAQSYIGKKGDIYTILQDLQDNRYIVKVTEGVVGYVNKADVDVIDLSSIPEKWGYTVTDLIAAHILPSASSNRVETLPLGTRVRILREEYGWYRVLLNSGKQGYIKKENLADAPTPTQPTGTIYTVMSGDTLWAISQKYGVTIDAIVKANNLNAGSYLYIGQKLVIPTVQAPPTSNMYTVKSGDALWKIAQSNGLTVNELIFINKLTAPYSLLVGQKLIIPKLHIVAAGDTLWKIATKYNTTIQKIVVQNNMDINKPLYIGQRILIA